MRLPLQVLAAGSILAGFVGVPAVLGGSNRIEAFLEPVLEPARHALGAGVQGARARPRRRARAHGR